MGLVPNSDFYDSQGNLVEVVAFHGDETKTRFFETWWPSGPLPGSSNSFAKVIIEVPPGWLIVRVTSQAGREHFEAWDQATLKSVRDTAKLRRRHLAEVSKTMSASAFKAYRLGQNQLIEGLAAQAVSEMYLTLTEYVPSDDAAALKVTVTVEEVALDGEGE